jgi:hypothetical protein
MSIALSSPSQRAARAHSHDLTSIRRRRALASAVRLRAELTASTFIEGTT